MRADKPNNKLLSGPGGINFLSHINEDHQEDSGDEDEFDFQIMKKYSSEVKVPSMEKK